MGEWELNPIIPETWQQLFSILNKIFQYLYSTKAKQTWIYGLTFPSIPGVIELHTCETNYFSMLEEHTGTLGQSMKHFSHDPGIVGL